MKAKQQNLHHTHTHTQHTHTHTRIHTHTQRINEQKHYYTVSCIFYSQSLQFHHDVYSDYYIYSGTISKKQQPSLKTKYIPLLSLTDFKIHAAHSPCIVFPSLKTSFS